MCSITVFFLRPTDMKRRLTLFVFVLTVLSLSPRAQVSELGLILPYEVEQIDDLISTEELVVAPIFPEALVREAHVKTVTSYSKTSLSDGELQPSMQASYSRTGRIQSQDYLAGKEPAAYIWEYDEKGEWMRVMSKPGSPNRNTDYTEHYEDGRLLRRNGVMWQPMFNIRYTYDDKGRRIRKVYEEEDAPHVETNFTYDEAGRLTRIWRSADGFTSETNVRYDAQGRLSEWDSESEQGTSRYKLSYDDAGRPATLAIHRTSSEWVHPAGSDQLSAKADFSHARGDSLSLAKHREPYMELRERNQEIRFEYDELGRLIRAVRHHAEFDQIFTYTYLRDTKLLSTLDVETETVDAQVHVEYSYEFYD